MMKLEIFERSPKFSELRAVYKSRTKASSRKNVCHPEDVTEYLRTIWDRDTIELREEFIVLCLNGAHQVTGWVKIASGGMTSAQVDPRLVFGIALQTASTAIIVAHNHPSGNTRPSDNDRRVTGQLKEAGKLLGITLLDHVILGPESAYSFADNGTL